MNPSDDEYLGLSKEEYEKLRRIIWGPVFIHRSSFLYSVCGLCGAAFMQLTYDLYELCEVCRYTN
jgi:hypothetical protein